MKKIVSNDNEKQQKTIRTIIIALLILVIFAQWKTASKYIEIQENGVGYLSPVFAEFIIETVILSCAFWGLRKTIPKHRRVWRGLLLYYVVVCLIGVIMLLFGWLSLV